MCGTRLIKQEYYRYQEKQQRYPTHTHLLCYMTDRSVQRYRRPYIRSVVLRSQKG